MVTHRPVLVCVPQHKRPPQKPPCRVRFPICDLPRRVVLRTEEAHALGMPLALSLARRTARGKPLPQMIAIEVDPAHPIAFVAIAHLLAYCSPTPATSRYLRAVRPTLPTRPDPCHHSLFLARYSAVRGLTLLRTLRIVGARPSAHTALATILAIVSEARQSRRYALLMHRVIDSAVQTLRVQDPTAATFWEEIALASASVRAPSLSVYRAYARCCPARSAALVKAVMAYVYAVGQSVRVKTDAEWLRAASRAEARCRTAGLTRLCALARSFRRRVASAQAAVPVQRIVYRSLRCTVLVGSRSSAWSQASFLAFNSVAVYCRSVKRHSPPDC